MATTTITCSTCPWSDERDATTRPPSTCPGCGGNALVIDGQAPVAEVTKKKPAQKRRR